MAAPTYKALRQALYTRLDAQLSVPVWSPKAPQNAQGESLSPFPYVAIVQAAESAWNTNQARGGEFVVQIDGYARATAAASAEDAILTLWASTREALEWYSLTVTGAIWVDTKLDLVNTGWDDGGDTRRFVSQWRITLDESA
jgi:hypothetical protein